MRTIVAAVLLAISAVPSAGQEPSDARFRQLGECIAYFAVEAGLDGQKKADPATAGRIRALASEFMFEASTLGYDDDKAHTFVVERLAEQNMLVSEQGTAALTASHGQMCAALSSSLSAR